MSNHYEIGYKKPPVNTQFKKGVSGNPQGRPKGSNNFKTALSQELDKNVYITEAGKTEKMTKRQALPKILYSKAASGDYRSIIALIRLDQECEEDDRYVDALTNSKKSDECYEIDILKILEGLGK